MNYIPTKIVFLFCIAILVTIVTYKYFNETQSQQQCPLDHYRMTIVQINEHELTVDIASTEAQRTCGLSHRNKLPENYGMLFVFEKNQILDFWMKDTHFPLTIAYIDENFKIMELHQFNADQINIDKPSKELGRYALESSPEWFAKNNIQVGDYVKFNLPEN